jgi:hypothetical protein
LWVDGERAAGSGIAVTEDDLWHFGSITKSVTHRTWISCSTAPTLIP